MLLVPRSRRTLEVVTRPVDPIRVLTVTTTTATRVPSSQWKPRRGSNRRVRLLRLRLCGMRGRSAFRGGLGIYGCRVCVCGAPAGSHLGRRAWRCPPSRPSAAACAARNKSVFQRTTLSQMGVRQLCAPFLCSASVTVVCVHFHATPKWVRWFVVNSK